MTGFPLDSHVTYDSSGKPIYDRAVSSAPLREMINKFFSSGVFPAPSTNLKVVPGGGMSVKVLSGTGLCNGCIKVQEEDKIISVSSSGTTPRTDTIVLRLDTNDSVRSCELDIVQGTSTTPPELTRNNTKYEIGLANIAVSAGASVISETNIIDTRADTSRCGYITVKGETKYILPIASSNTLGGVKVGSGLEISGTGVLNSTAKTIQVENKLDSTSATNALSANMGKTLNEKIESAKYTLPIASTTKLGGIKVGSGLEVDSSGTMKALGVAGIVDDLTSSATDKALSANQGRVLKGLVDSKIVVDNLTTSDATKALSAKQGVALKGLVDSKVVVDSLTSSDTNKALSANQGKVLKKMIDDSEYTLPRASRTRLGGIYVGDGLEVDADGNVTNKANIRKVTAKNAVVTQWESCGWMPGWYYGNTGKVFKKYAKGIDIFEVTSPNYGNWGALTYNVYSNDTDWLTVYVYIQADIGWYEAKTVNVWYWHIGDTGGGI